ncbi:MAG: calcium/sodium antiporter [Alphaproteobacteria bacterium]|nr:calcium/sodium antiporter [Alphaproteobacteria bacterium]
MAVEIFFSFLGLFLLFFGGEFLVRGAIVLAERFKVPALIVGLFVTGLGTSMPELLVCANAALSGMPEVALGNVIGSNIANILLIVGSSSLIAPVAFWSRMAAYESFISFLVLLFFYLLLWTSFISRFYGALLLFFLLIYLFSVFLRKNKEEEPLIFESEVVDFKDILVPNVLFLPVLLIISGIVFLGFGSHFLVDGVSSIARAVGVSEAVIGLSFIAVGTSLPELATGIVAALRRHPDVVLGNAIGSNIFNVLFILGTTAMIHPIEIDNRFPFFDGPVMLISAFFFFCVLFFCRRINRVGGIFSVGIYVLYILFLSTSE